MTIFNEEFYYTPWTLDKLNQSILEAQRGNENATKEIVENHIRLILKVINQNFSTLLLDYPILELDDLLNIGTIGFIRAIQNYDLTRSTKFYSYVVPCIKNEILMEIRKLAKQRGMLSLEAKFQDEDGEALEPICLLNMLRSKDDITKHYELLEEHQKLKEALCSLTLKERTIIDYYFGINGKSLNQSEIAQGLGISQSYLSRIFKKVLKKLKENLETNYYLEEKTPTK